MSSTFKVLLFSFVSKRTVILLQIIRNLSTILLSLLLLLSLQRFNVVIYGFHIDTFTKLSTGYSQSETYQPFRLINLRFIMLTMNPMIKEDLDSKTYELKALIFKLFDG